MDKKKRGIKKYLLQKNLVIREKYPIIDKANKTTIIENKKRNDMPSYYLTKTGKTNNNSYNVDKLSRKFENKSMIPENSFYSAKVKTQYFVVERKRTENHEKFNKEINKANNVLENLLETCNKMLSNSQFLQNTSSAQESKREEKKEKTKETDYEEDFEYYSAEFNGNILENRSPFKPETNKDKIISKSINENTEKINEIHDAEDKMVNNEIEEIIQEI